jgi:predicted nucleic acid-binding protein
VIVLDTNVVSELMRPVPAPEVVAWLDRQGREPTTVTAMTVAELLYGVLRLPAGRRRDEVTSALLDMLENDLRPEPLPFDLAAAEHFAEIAADREAAGRPIATADAVIAATCRTRGAVLATRNAKDFDLTGVDVVNPWDAVAG